jgi:hypothetical protein
MTDRPAFDDRVHARAYLIAYDLCRDRLYDRKRAALLVAAGVLAEALIGGWVEESGGRVHVIADVSANEDRALTAALGRIGETRRGWSHWIRTLRNHTLPDIETIIAADGARPRTQTRRWHSVAAPSLADHAQRIAACQDRAREVLTGRSEIAEIDRRDAAMTVIAAAGRIPAVASRRELHRHRNGYRYCATGSAQTPPGSHARCIAFP